MSLGDKKLIIDKVSNAKKGITAGFLHKVVSILMPFFVQTFLIRKLGIEYVGLHGVFSSILTVLSVAELGFGSAIVFSMYEPIAHDDNETLCALLSFYRKVYRIVGSIILAIGLAITPFLGRVVSQNDVGVNIYIIFLLYLVNVSLSYFLFSYKASLLNAFQRTDVSSIVNAVVTVAMGVLQILILNIFMNFYLFLCVAITFTILNNILIAKMTVKMFPDISEKGEINKELLADIEKRVKGVLISKICGITRNAFDSVFVSAFLGLAVSGIYSNYYYVMNSVAGILGILYPAVLGGIGNSIQLESAEKNYQDMIRINYIYMMISGWFAICLLCLYQPFMTMWAGRTNVFATDIMILFVVYFYIRQMGNVRAIYSDAAGLFWENRFRTLAEAIANIVLNYVFVKKFGVSGIIGATIITLFFIGFLGSTEVIFRCYFGSGMRKYLMSTFRNALTTSAIAIVSWYVCSCVHAEGVAELLLRTFICLTIPPLLFFLTGMATDKNTLLWFYKGFVKGGRVCDQKIH